MKRLHILKTKNHRERIPRAGRQELIQKAECIAVELKMFTGFECQIDRMKFLRRRDRWRHER